MFFFVSSFCCFLSLLHGKDLRTWHLFRFKDQALAAPRKEVLTHEPKHGQIALELEKACKDRRDRERHGYIDRRGRIHIQRAVVYDKDGQLVSKSPKTYASNRFVQIPDAVAAKIRTQGFVTTLSPRQVSRRFVRLLKDSGVDPFRFHDLRHFFVSYCHTVLRLSDAQIQSLGGWSSSYVMNNFYRQTMNEKQAALLVSNKMAALLE